MSSRRPRTYLEKVRYRLAFDRNPILTAMVDKIAVRALVRSVLGPEVLPTCHAIARNPDDVDWNSLPREFVAKASHGSGGTVIVWDGAPPDARLPDDPSDHPWGRFQVRPEHADPARLTSLLRYWMTLDYSWFPGKQWPEWAYEGVPPGLLVEEFLHTPAGLPSDIKLHVIHGRVAYIEVMTDRSASGHLASIYLPDWTPTAAQLSTHGQLVPAPSSPPPPPPNAAELVATAERLGHLVDAVRVDLYSLPTRIVFGELTVYPNAGEGHFVPMSFGLEVGALWRQAYG